ncbi:hypothetical protein PTTG_25867 [Puccinia triticina 1-1 BBBD Race 1]|uniref:Uncharacterized protein n=1 Tax=Puccinia triticina (isolate 1-1 / race 1 (BBBD)) TaxID=630390 RepID=A0A180GYJ4_PUCT1|nr:hypothetical protein PTTG_25867 [Puccinia triticina 1-1 BBBD Race 1]
MCLENLPPLSEQAKKVVFIDRVMYAYNLDPKPISRTNHPRSNQIKTTNGKACWSAYILSEAKHVIAAEGGAHGQFPQGNYYNSKKITPAFFSDEEKAARMEQHVTHDMPFQHNLILHKVQKERPAATKSQATNTASGSSGKRKEKRAATSGSNLGILVYDSDTSDSNTALAGLVKKKHLNNGDNLLTRKTKASPAETEDVEEELDRKNRPHMIAATVCLMVAFGANRCNNALQIQNTVV